MRPMETIAMRIMGFFKKDSGETICVLANPSFVFLRRAYARRTALSFLIKVLGCHRSCLDDKPISALTTVLALVVPLIS